MAAKESTEKYRESLKILKRDEYIALLIKKYGTPDLTRYHADSPGVFQSLLRSIVYQQLSGKAAAAILSRVIALFPKSKPTPQALLKINVHKLRAAGLSVQKIRYVRDLAQKCLDGTVDPKKFPKMTSQEIIEHLTAVMGVGEWTAHMLLIFRLERLDILPVGDLAIRKGFQKVYRLRTMPDKKKMEAIAKPWREYASVASWYLWRVADESKK